MTFPAFLGPVTVTLTATALTPAVGTPPRPRTDRWIVPYAATGPPAPSAVLVSRSRAGVSGAKLPGALALRAEPAEGAPRAAGAGDATAAGPTDAKAPTIASTPADAVTSRRLHVPRIS
ncbi:hypothetical protein GCM10022399_09620 [Terrabacter ginsenosidimutans]|uniref:Secreted protein n=1 Tax=Terrabacter ginsenosidimutans TaxID=490575 RepID=A0ABP7CRW9_9MICO